jgi:predicted permease
MWFRRRSDRDFAAEVEAHISLEADRLMEQGMAPEEAQAAARREFGNVTAVREQFYESRRWLWWEELRRDLRYGLRSLRRSPAFTLAAALTIALGVGANTAVFSLMDAVLLRLLPVDKPEELVFLDTVGNSGSSAAPPYPCFLRLRAEVNSFDEIAAFTGDELRIEIDGTAEQVMGQAASGNYFALLGVKAALGRLMTPDDEKLDPAICVISDRYWRRRFGADPAVIGKTISFRKQKFTIAGVTPPGFWGLEPGRPVDLTLPIGMERSLLADAGAWWFSAVARLKDGASGRQASAEANAVFQSFMADRQTAGLRKEYFDRLELRAAAHGLDGLRRRFSKPLYVLMGIAGLVLLMAAANIANLLLARGMARQREFAIRLATGAGRLRLIRQLLTETLLLFTIGAVPGVMLGRWGAGLMQAMFAEGRRALTVDAGLNWRVFAFTMAIALAAGLLAGLFPAWRAFRRGAEQSMREGHSRTGDSRNAALLARALVAVQVSLSLVLLTAAMTFVRTLWNLRSVDAGFREKEVLTMSVELPDDYLAAGKASAVWDRILEAVRSIPGLRSAGLAVVTPLSGRDRGAHVRIPGYEPPAAKDSLIHWNQVSEAYFETLGIPLLQGRYLSARDVEGTQPVALINEAAARKYFEDRDPIGQRLEFAHQGKTTRAYRIVGVVGDTKHMDLRVPAPPFVYLPLRQPRDAERRLTLVAAPSMTNGPMALLQPIRRTLAAVDSQIFVSEVMPIRRQLDSTLLTERLLSGLSAGFGALALVLAAVGLFGVLSYRIGRQRHAIGIRLALGASRSSVVFGVLRQSGVVVAAGLLLGLPLAILAARAADSLLWGIHSSDPGIYAAAVAVLGVIAFASTWLPARRASAIEPAEALRHD